MLFSGLILECGVRRRFGLRSRTGHRHQSKAATNAALQDHFFTTVTTSGGEAFCRLAAALAVPMTSTPLTAAAAAVGAAGTSSSTEFFPMAMAPLAAVTPARHFPPS